MYCFISDATQFYLLSSLNLERDSGLQDLDSNKAFLSSTCCKTDNNYLHIDFTNGVTGTWTSCNENYGVNTPIEHNSRVPEVNPIHLL